jgi:hypothetical protein
MKKPADRDGPVDEAEKKNIKRNTRETGQALIEQKEEIRDIRQLCLPCSK